MNSETGRIVREDEIPKGEKKKHVPIIAGALAALQAMSPEERLQALADDRRRSVGGQPNQYFNATIKPPASKAARAKKRKAQKLSRRKNRH